MTNQLAIKDTMTIADAFVQSGFFTDAKHQSQAIVKILAGQELGFGPMASMTGIHIVQGKPTISATLMAAALKNTGRYNYRIEKMTDEECWINFMELVDGKWEKIGVSTFSMEDAKQAGLLGNPTWKKYARNMLFARAMSNGVRWYAPDIFGAPLYTPDELGAEVDGETGEVIEVQPEVHIETNGNNIQGVISDTQRRRLHAIGKELYGDDWDEKRHTAVQWVTGGRTESSSELTVAQANKLINIMNDKLMTLRSATARVAGDDLEGIAAENPDSIHAEG